MAITMADDKHKDVYEEYYGTEKKAEGAEEKQGLSEFHKKILKLLGEKGGTSDKIADKLDVRENDVRRALNEMLVEDLVSYKKTVKNGKLSYLWKKR
jgi:transcription initiation factor IIE alpha subunit